MALITALSMLSKVVTSAKKGDFLESLSSADDFIKYFLAEKELTFEDLFKKAALTTFESQKDILSKYTDQIGEVEILTDDFIKEIKASKLAFNQQELLSLSEEDFIDKLSSTLKDNFLIGGSNLNDHDLYSLLNNFISQLRSELIALITKDQVKFNKLLFTYSHQQQKTLEEIKSFLSSNQEAHQELKTILISIQVAQEVNSGKLDKIYQEVRVSKMNFLDLIAQLKIDLSKEDNYDSYGLKEYFKEHNRKLLEQIEERGEESFLQLLSAILLPMDQKFNKDKIDYKFNYLVIKKIIRVLVFMKIKYPELNLEYAAGKAFRVAETKNICYLHTENDKKIEAAVIEYLNYDSPNLPPRINCFLINKAQKEACINLEKGARINIDQIVNKITEVISFKTGETPMIDLTEKYKFRCHCGSCFNAYSITNRSDLDDKLSLLLEGESHDS